MIRGVQVQSLEVHRDARGSFTEVFSDEWTPGFDARQWSVVRSGATVLRGMYFHRRHDEYFLLMEGKCCVGLYDLRHDSSTWKESMLIEFSADEPAYLCLPAGVLHGWYFHEPSVHLQGVSEPYSEYHADDNLGCHWADADLGIAWPEGPKLLSERSAALPSLRSLIDRLSRKDGGTG